MRWWVQKRPLSSPLRLRSVSVSGGEAKGFLLRRTACKSASATSRVLSCPFLELVNAFLVDVIAHDGVFGGKEPGEREADIAQADDGDFVHGQCVVFKKNAPYSLTSL